MANTSDAYQSDDRANPSGRTVPVWYGDVELPNMEPFPGSFRTDVCVVGAGIAGLTTAYCLAKAGRSVAILDQHAVAGGETGRTTAHLASAIDDRFQNIERLHGLDVSRRHYQSHVEAINLIEQIQRDETIDYDFHRVDGYLFLHDGQSPTLLEEELAAALRIGVSGVRLQSAVPTGLQAHGPCLLFPNQGRIHPLKYVAGLVQSLKRMGVRLYSNARVRSMVGDGPVEISLHQAGTVVADFAVAATNVPSPNTNWIGVYTKQAAYRSYAIAFEAGPSPLVDALYWDTADPYRYVRLHTLDSRPVLIVGGADHKTGQHPSGDADPFAALEAWTRGKFLSVGARIVQWSGQVQEPDDAIAFIGRVPTRGHKACFAITGDSGMGMTHATLGARLVADLILDRANPWADIYDPARRTPGAVADFVRENANAAAQLGEYLTPGEVDAVEQIAPGAGALMRSGLTKIAVYRDIHGKLHRCSAICPHLKCVVRWNPVETSWDCPCHGSRFDEHGRLLSGPATEDLKIIDESGSGTG